MYRVVLPILKHKYCREFGVYYITAKKHFNLNQVFKELFYVLQNYLFALIVEEGLPVGHGRQL